MTPEEWKSRVAKALRKHEQRMSKPWLKRKAMMKADDFKALMVRDALKDEKKRA